MYNRPMSNRNRRRSGNNRREQTPKVITTGRNEAWARAKMDLARRNNTVPSGKVYKRPSPGREIS